MTLPAVQPAGVIDEVYFAVPRHYTIGERFPGTPEGHRDAIAAAKRSIQRFTYASGPSYSRAFVDRRYKISWRDGTGEDRSVERVEIKLTDAEKLALA